MSQDEAQRIVAAARSLRSREGPGFALTRLARPAGLSRATLYRRLSANKTLAEEIERIRTEGSLNAREELLRAGISLLADRGLRSLTMEDVAAKAGLSTATLYRYFTDRDDFVREVLRHSLPVQPVRVILHSDGPVEEVLERFVGAALARARVQPYIFRLHLLEDEHELREVQKLRRSEDRVSTALIEYFERNANEFPGATAKQLAASLIGQVLGAFIFQRNHDSSESVDAKAIVKLFLHGALRNQQGRKTT